MTVVYAITLRAGRTCRRLSGWWSIDRVARTFPEIACNVAESVLAPMRGLIVWFESSAA